MLTHKTNDTEYKYQGIPIHAAMGLHEKCMDIVRQSFCPGCSILDIAAGSGAFTQRLLNSGYEVQANDVDHTTWAVPALLPWKLDLNQDIPTSYSDHKFDGIAAIEVIEHLENPMKFLRDCKTFLKPEGRLLLTTPNILDPRSYFAYLRKGTFALHNERMVYTTGHISILPSWLLEQFFSLVGLEIVEQMTAGRIGGLAERYGPAIQATVQYLTRGRIPKYLREGACVCYLLKIRKS
jgi:2-polyprenyl-3-methyl-5-hydroxy-6-metoxy-1,4-benzoquinol methylase